MPNWKTGSCRSDAAEVHYVRTGGAGPALVLLHGLTASGACWRPLARALEAEFDVVMPDARGHGHSSAPLHGYSYDDHASDAVALIRQLGLTAPFLLGHSMGGMTAALVASRAAKQLGAPIRGLVLADPTFLSPVRQREVRDSAVAEQHHRLLGLGKDRLLAEARLRHPQRSDEVLELISEARLQTRISAFDVLTPPNPDYRQLVSEISAPTLLIIGGDSVVSLEAAGELRGLNPRVRVEQIEDAGHGVPYDQPERFATAVRRFLRRAAGSFAHY